MAVSKASIAELLLRYRAAAELTQEALAEQAGLSARSISDLERGIARHPYPHTVRRLARALRLDAQEALRLEEAARQTGHEAERETPAPRNGSGLNVQGMRRTNLPVQPTTFVGRGQEVADVTQMLRREDVRLLTLTGPGGVGKTRLALRAAENELGAFPDGVIFVSLASLADAALVPSAVVTALGAADGSGRSHLEILTSHIRDKRLLLVIDNFEHLLSAADVVSQLLPRCPRLKVLATSRAFLHLAAEHLYPVPPFPVPPPSDLLQVEALSRYDVVQLFVKRARAVTPNFQLSDENAAAIAEICCRLDGLPLAIELAAAQIRLFPPHMVLARLGHRLDALTDGPRDQPARQHTLRRTIDWSYSLLGGQEREIFWRLGLFAGGCTLRAAEAVCMPEGEVDILAGLAVLLNQSLVQEMENEEPRFFMLETIREYAVEKLDETGQGRALRGAHARFFLTIAEEAEPELIGPAQAEWLPRLDAELDNIRGALHWFLKHRATDEGLRLVTALDRFWHSRGYLREERQWLEEGLAHGDGSPAVHAKAVWTLGRILWLQGAVAHATVLLEEALALYQDLEDRRGIARTLNLLGNTHGYQGQFERGRSFHLESIRLWQELGELGESARPLQNLGRMTGDQGDLVAGRAYISEALEIYRVDGDVRGIAITLTNLARFDVMEDKLAEGTVRADEALALSRTLEDRQLMVTALLVLSKVARKRGRLEEAAGHLREALLLCQKTGQPDVFVQCLEEAVALATTQSAPERAACMRGALSALLENFEHCPPSTDLLEAKGMLTEAEAMPEGKDLIRAWERGRAMSLEEAVAYALDESQ